MKKIGEVVSILNEEYLLIKSTETLVIGSNVDVYQEIKNPKIKRKLGLDSIQIPKGKLKVIAPQTDNIYLCGIAYKEETVTRYNNNLALAISGIQNLIATPETITKKEPEGLIKPKLDSSKSLNISFNELITLGDYVGIE